MTTEEKIRALKVQRNAVILAHNYVTGDIQDVADFVGDSLELSRKAAALHAPVIVVCGVSFMAETVKLLSPESTVLMVCPEAGCPMAAMAPAAEVAKCRAENPGATLVAYVNTAAAAKAEVDICCTSGNADRIVQALEPGRKVIFLPDRNLGANLNRSCGMKMQLWNGCCPIHDAVTVGMIAEARRRHPDAEVLVHPECRPEVVAAADRALSTGGMLRHIAQSDRTQFVIGTESGIVHRLKKENPNKKFHTLSPELICSDMKKMTLADVARALETMEHPVELDPVLAGRAVASIRKMLEIQ